MPLLLLVEDELRQAVSLAEAIETVELTFAAFAEGRLTIPNTFTLELPDVHGLVQVDGAYLSEAPYYVVKVGNFFFDNPTINLPTQSDVTIVFDAATGFPAAMMLDHGYLTQVRAGAVGAVAARYLANPELKRVAVIGSGKQAYIQLKMLLMIKNLSIISVWGRTPLNVDTYARQLIEEHDLNIEIASSVQAAVTDADLIITATSSQQPLIQAEWLKPGVHITAVGSNSPTKQELHSAVLERADVIIVDKYSQCAATGEIHHGLVDGVITASDVQGELSELVIGKIPGRLYPEQITVADLTGRDVQDSAIAILALEKAYFLGLGRRL